MGTATPINGRFPRFPGHAPATAKLIEALRAGAPGDVLTDERLEAICGRPTGTSGRGYSNLAAAIGFVEREYGLIWRRLWGAAAIRCLLPDEISATSRSALGRIHHRARRERRVLMQVDADSLSEVERPRARAQLAMLGAVEMFTRADTAKKLEVRPTGENIDFQRMLEAFK